MPGEREQYSWIFELGFEAAQEALAARKLSTDGIIPVLRKRLLKNEMATAREEDSRTPLATSAEFFSGPVTDPLGTSVSGEGAKAATRQEEPVLPNSTRLLRAGLPSFGGARPRQSESLPIETLYNLLQKWNLRFSGDRDGEDADDFLTDIAVNRTIVPVPDRDLLQCLPLFLTGTARLWFMDRHARWVKWREFEAAFRQRFGAPDYQSALRREVERRTQGERERAADYITRLKAMLDRLSPPWSLTEQLDLVRRNMLPRVRALIRRDDYYDYETLEDAAIRAEAEVQADAEYRPPPPPERTLIPRLAYHPPKSSPRVGVAAAPEPGRSGKSRDRQGERTRDRDSNRRGTEDPAPSAAAPSPQRGEGNVERAAPTRGQCWNCLGSGHIAKNCPQPPRLHCYRCGRQGCSVKTCPNCAGNAAGGR